MRSMVVYGSFLDATEDLPVKVFKEVWLAVLKYGIDGIEPETLSASAKMAFNLVKPNIDANKKRRKNTNANNCKQLQTIVNSNVHFSIDGDEEYIDGDVDVDEDVDVDVEGDGDIKEQRARARGSHPTLDEIRAYCEERQNNIDPEQFYDFYASKGWKIGKSPMKDWKACVRTWEKRRKEESEEKSTVRSSPYIEAIHNRMDAADRWLAKMEGSG